MLENKGIDALRSELREGMRQLHSQYNRIMYGIVLVILIPIAVQYIFHIISV